VNIPQASANDLIFGWDTPARGKWTIVGFLFASLAVHALGFYLFQILYPPAVALLPPPGRISLITPNSDEGLLLLRWLNAEDPALASTTQPPVDGKSLTMPTIQHAPSYLGRQPPLREAPTAPAELRVPSAHPPVPVERLAPRPQSPAKTAPTVVRFSPEFDKQGPAQSPDFKFGTSGRESPQAARFRIAVDEKGTLCYCFLQDSSGDAALDAQARAYLMLCRFSSTADPAPAPTGFTWGTATVEWGNDIVSSSSPAPGNSAP
jgi:hypothetical protein